MFALKAEGEADQLGPTFKVYSCWGPENTRHLGHSIPTGHPMALRSHGSQDTIHSGPVIRMGGLGQQGDS